MEDPEKTQSDSSRQTAHPQYTERQTQQGSHSPHDKGTHKSQTLPKGTTTDPKDSRGNDQPADKGLPSTVPNKELVDQTQSTRLWYHSLIKNKGKPSYEEELHNQPLILSTGVDVQALLFFNEELMEESKDHVFEAGDEMDEDIHHTDEEETQSPSPTKEQPESSHAQEIGELDSDSSRPEVLKKYDNVLPLTERKLVKYLQNVSQTLYNRLTKDQWEKHKEAAASYADLKSKIEGFHDPAYKVHKGTEAAFSTYEKLPNLGPRLTSIESTQSVLRSEISSLRQDTSDIKSMMTELFQFIRTHPELEMITSPITIKLTKQDHEILQFYSCQEPKRPLRAVPISIVRPLMRTHPELEMMTSLATVKLTNTTLEFHTSQDGVEIELIGSSTPPQTAPVIDITPCRNQ
ncbi:hypothetical protein Tco_0659140 [Tanacetum coccineum]